MTVQELLTLCETRVAAGDGDLEVFVPSQAPTKGNVAPLRVCEKVLRLAETDFYDQRLPDRDILVLDGWWRRDWGMDPKRDEELRRAMPAP